MIARLRPKLTYSNVLASLALFIALGGAAVAAGLPKNSVGANQLKQGSVTAKKIRREAVTNLKLKGGSISASKLASDAVTGGSIAAGAVSSGKLAKNAVINASIANGAVGNSKLANEAISNTKLQKESVTGDKIKNGTVGTSKLSADVPPLLGTLRTGQTLRGQFAVGGPGGSALWAAQSFQFPLNNPPKAEVIDPPTATTPNCQGITGGSGQTPQAAAGYLCFYVTSKKNIAAAGLTVPGVALTRLGFALEGVSEAAGDFYASGQWAVTSP